MLKILKDISVYTIGDLLAKGIGFFAVIFYTHLISKAEMGVYGYMMIIVGFASTFLLLGADNAYARYFFEYKTNKEKQILTTTLLFFLIFWTFFIIIFPLIYSKKIVFYLLKDEDYSFAFCLALVLLPLKIISSLSNQALRNQFQIKKFITLNFLASFFSVLSAIILLKLSDLGISAIFLGMILGYTIVLPFRFYAIRDLWGFDVDFSILKKILCYGVPFLPTSIAYWIFSSADRFMLESMTGIENVGVYTVAAFLANILNILAGALSQAWSPHAMQSYEKNHEEAKLFYIRFLNLLIYFILFVLFLVSMIGKEILFLFLPPSYRDIFYPVLLLLTGIGFQITTQVTASGISLRKKTIYFFYITSIIACANIAMNFLLIPLYQEIGASIATASSFMLLTFLYAKISQKLFYLPYNPKTIILSLGILLAIYAFSFFPIWIRLFILFSVLFGIYTQKESIIRLAK